MKWIDYIEEVKPFEDGDEFKALDYLVHRERIDRDKRDYWATSIEMIKYQKHIFIEWANDVLQQKL